MRKKGSILIVTLWTLSFLAIFAVGIARVVGGQLHLASHLQDRLKTYYLAQAGIERAITILTADETEKRDSLDEQWANSEELFKEIPLSDGYVTVSYRIDESSEEQQQTEQQQVPIEQQV